MCTVQKKESGEKTEKARKKEDRKRKKGSLRWLESLLASCLLGEEREKGKESQDNQ